MKQYTNHRVNIFFVKKMNIKPLKKRETLSGADLSAAERLV